MPRTLNRLKSLAIDKVEKPGRYADGGGLYLVVKPGDRTTVHGIRSAFKTWATERTNYARVMQTIAVRPAGGL